MRKSFNFILLALVFFLSFVPELTAQDSSSIYKKYQQIELKSPQSKLGLTEKERQSLFRHVYNHPVASPNRIDEYEPFPGDPARAVGYCFGRAMAVHLFARSMGVRSQSIRKLFIIGDLRQKGATSKEWGFHVTTVIQDTRNKNQWFAIDPIMMAYTGGRSQPMQHWIDTVQDVWDSWEVEGKHFAKFYLTANSAVMPEARDEKNRIWDHRNFKPENEQGFKPIQLGEEDTVYQLSSTAQDRHFAGIDEPADTAFPLLGIWLLIDSQMGQEYFDFKNYFVNLIESVLDTRGIIPATRLERSFAEATALKDNGANLRSMSFQLVPQPQEK